MDIFEYRSQLVIDTTGVFDGREDPSDDLAGCFLRLKNLTVSEVHLRWDIAYLEEYVKVNMVPRSLRWEVNPQKEDNELAEWFKYFNEAGVGFLQFLIAKKKRRLTMLDIEINIIKAKLTPFKENQEYTRKSESLKTLLIKEESEQKLKKRRKYNRDAKDYRDNLVFKWQVPASTDPPTTITSSNIPRAQAGPRSQGIHGNTELESSQVYPPSPHSWGGARPRGHSQHTRGRGGRRNSSSRSRRRSPVPWRRLNDREAHHDFESNQRRLDFQGQKPRGNQRKNDEACEQYGVNVGNRFSPLYDGMNDKAFDSNRDYNPLDSSHNRHTGDNRPHRDFQWAGRGRNKRNGDAREGAEGGGSFTPKRRRI